MHLLRRQLLLGLGASAGALSLPACGKAKISAAKSVPLVQGAAPTDAGAGDVPPDPSVTGTVEVMSWWGGPESGAIDALVAGFAARYPNVSVTNSALDGLIAWEVSVQQRAGAGDPPDLLLLQGGRTLISLAVNSYGKDLAAGVAVKLDDVYAGDNLAAVIPQGILDLVSYNGDVYAVPLSLARGNSLYFNKKVFADAGLTPPTTWDQFFTVSRALEAKGVVPLALCSASGEGSMALVFMVALLGAMGPAPFRRLLEGNGNPADPAFGAAAQTFVSLLQHTNASADLLLRVTGDATRASAMNASQLKWTDAADMLHEGAAAMVIQGDWLYGHLQASYGADAIASVGVTAAPGTSGIFMANLDTFFLSKGARSPDNGRLLLRYMASRPGQDTFNPKKGAISVRIDADATKYDPAPRAVAADYAAAAAAGNIVSVHTMALPYTVEADLEGLTNKLSSDAVTGTGADKIGQAIVSFMTDRYPEIQAY